MTQRESNHRANWLLGQSFQWETFNLSSTLTFQLLPSWRRSCNIWHQAGTAAAWCGYYGAGRCQKCSRLELCGGQAAYQGTALIHYWYNKIRNDLYFSSVTVKCIFTTWFYFIQCTKSQAKASVSKFSSNLKVPNLVPFFVQ